MENKVHILIVQDNISPFKTMAFILERKGYIVAIAKDGSEVIAKVKDHPFDIILLDIKVPFMDGVETYKRINKILPQAAAIMMTAYRQEIANLVAQTLKSTALTCLGKPIDIEKTLTSVDGVLKRKRRAG
jgi:DNA-binding NtrC family response regulator